METETCLKCNYERSENVPCKCGKLARFDSTSEFSSSVHYRMEGLNVFNNWQPLTPWHETTVEPLAELEAYADVNGENHLGWKDWRIVKRTIETVPPNTRI